MSNANEKARQMRSKKRLSDLAMRKGVVSFARRWEQIPDYGG